MALLKTENLSFYYPDCDKAALDNLTLEINKGEFIVLMGKTGAGKSTLLRLLKKEIAPHGTLKGSLENNFSSTAFVPQNPDTSFVCENVRGELAFALENQKLESERISLKIGETASFFNLTDLLDNRISNLSGGERCIVSIASSMIADCELLVLDEPLAQLDPKSANQILNLIKRINDELGVTVIMSTHISDGIVDICDKMLILDNGKKVAFASPEVVAKQGEYSDFFPVYTNLFDAKPLSVKDAIACDRRFSEKPIEKSENKSSVTALSLKNITFAYAKNEADVLSSLSFKAFAGEIHSVIGANASGKTTLLKVIAGIKKPYYGKVSVNSSVAYLPQNPCFLFTKDKVSEEIDFKSARMFELEELLDNHPYDLSAGQMQRLALAILSSKNFDILVLDEPTKSLDTQAKNHLSSYLKSLTSSGKTVIIATHDLDFAGQISDRVSFLSDGIITITGGRREVFSSLNYYTTQIRRITKSYLSSAVSAEDIE